MFNYCTEGKRWVGGGMKTNGMYDREHSGSSGISTSSVNTVAAKIYCTKIASILFL